jgi:hypothetical protein
MLLLELPLLPPVPEPPAPPLPPFAPLELPVFQALLPMPSTVLPDTVAFNVDVAATVVFQVDDVFVVVFVVVAMLFELL